MNGRELSEDESESTHIMEYHDSKDGVADGRDGFGGSGRGVFGRSGRGSGSRSQGSARGSRSGGIEMRRQEGSSRSSTGDERGRAGGEHDSADGAQGAVRLQGAVASARHRGEDGDVNDVASGRAGDGHVLVRLDSAAADALQVGQGGGSHDEEGYLRCDRGGRHGGDRSHHQGRGDGGKGGRRDGERIGVRGGAVAGAVVGATRGRARDDNAAVPRDGAAAGKRQGGDGGDAKDDDGATGDHRGRRRGGDDGHHDGRDSGADDKRRGGERFRARRGGAADAVTAPERRRAYGGDAPIIGDGAASDDRQGGCSTTGPPMRQGATAGTSATAGDVGPRRVVATPAAVVADGLATRDGGARGRPRCPARAT